MTNTITNHPSNPYILVVDDEAFIREFLEGTLKNHGYKVQTAHSGSDGWEKIQAEPPDLILLDVLLPDLSGHAVCTRVKSSPQLRDIPVVMLTALNQTEDKVLGLDIGADDYIGKPFKEKELVARIRAHLRVKKLHDELQKSYIKLKEVEELKDSLTHMIVHDLKTPITTVKGGLEVVLELTEEDGYKIHKDLKVLLEKALTGTGRLVELVEDMLEITQLQENRFPLKKKEVKVEDLIQSCLDYLEPIRQQIDARLVKVVSPDLPLAKIDEHLILRTLSNLISNSLKFTRAGDTITVSARMNGTDTVVFSVHDTGLGIPKESLDKIFDKFYQEKNKGVERKGQGLGLNFCRMAVQAHGGKIWAESEEQKGSKFIFEIPLG